jgi:uncharacterized protein YegL
MRIWRSEQAAELDASTMTFDDGDNRAQRLLLALVLDISSSMSGKPIKLLNEALAGMAEDLRQDANLSAIAEVAIVTFGNAGVTAWRGTQRVPPGTSPFVPASRFEAPPLSAGGVTPMVAAVERAIACVAEEKAALKRRHLQYFQPLVWLVSDGCPTDHLGHPTDDWRHLPGVISKAEDERKFVFFSVSAGDIDAAGDRVLQEIAPEAHVRLEGFEFSRMVKLVSRSVDEAAQGHGTKAIKRIVTSQRPVNRW